MKKLIYLFFLIGLSSCEFYFNEPAYDNRNELLGRFSVEEYSETYNDVTHYSIWIENGSRNSNQVYIDNFYGVDIRVCATVSLDKLTIHRQVVNGYEVEGVGTYYGSEITFSYRVKDIYSNYRTDFCDAIASLR